MALDPLIIDQIRDEIGNDAETDIADDDTLEAIFNDEDRGNSSVLTTALIVWRRRLHNLQSRSFDVATEGSLLSRNQRIRFIERRIKELENIADESLKGRNHTVLTTVKQAANLEESGTEYA